MSNGWWGRPTSRKRDYVLHPPCHHRRRHHRSCGPFPAPATRRPRRRSNSRRRRSQPTPHRALRSPQANSAIPGSCGPIGVASACARSSSARSAFPTWSGRRFGRRSRARIREHFGPRRVLKPWGRKTEAARRGMRRAALSRRVRRVQSRTYSCSTARLLMPRSGGAIQPAILPGSITWRMRLLT